MSFPKKIEPVIRDLKDDESGLLRDLFYYAIFMPKGANPLPFSIVDHPDLIKYHHEWGREGDIAIVAEVSGEVTGAAWCRLWTHNERGYGYLADNIPELSMAVIPEFRNLGIGTLLLNQFFKAVKNRGYNALSISVEKRNRAVNLYRRIGFKIIKDQFPDFLMQVDL